MIHNIQSYKPTETDKFFVDTNIWLFLHCPIGNHNQKAVEQYSKFFKNLVTAKSKILISSQVMSEFVNRYTRLDFALKRDSDRNICDYKKDYRLSEYYKSTAKLIQNALNNKILPRCEQFNDRFDTISTANILGRLDTIDINDSYLAEQIDGQEIKVLTDDADFGVFKDKCEIYTSNPRLLKM